ncbi:MAG: family 43 glycosylhydrolase, partial [Firmicutes bacterium]|nr:family 43 glycosylhydrolase [Bacillota bacterium]
MLKKGFFVLLVVMLGLTSSIALAQETRQAAMVPPLMSASVHDPSIIKAGDAYYVFGSHLAAAKSKDLRNWTSIETRVHDKNRLIPNVYTELEETFTWAQTDTLWAPDVAQLPDGRFYMY